QPEPLLRVERGQLGELLPGLGLLRGLPVDGVQADQRAVLLPVPAAAGVLLRAVGLDGAGDRIALAQTVLAHRAHRDVDVAGAGQVAGGADEPVVVQDVQHAGDGDEHVLLAVAGLLLVVLVVAPVAATLAVPATLSAAAAAAAAPAVLVVVAVAASLLVTLAVVLP